MLRMQVFVFIGLFRSMASAQDCGAIDYITPQFTVEVEYDVLYGTAERFDGGTDSLRMNIHWPVGDGVNERPLLIAVHGGAFISGDRSDMDELCDRYAARGYVAATVSYRLGFHPPAGLPTPYAYDEAEVLRASYRAQQDVKGAIRFLRGRHDLDQSSAENVFVYGVSAGGITGMHVSYATAEEERPASSFALPAVGQFQRNDLGAIAGALHVGEHGAEVKACVSHLGALLDTALVGSSEDPALFTYHQTGDPIVGCGHQQALWGAPLGIGANYPWLFGSCAIDLRMHNLGFTAERYEFHPHTGTAHDIHDVWSVDGLAAVFLARQFCAPDTRVADAVSGSFSTILQEEGSLRVLSIEPVVELLLMDGHGRSVSMAKGPLLTVRGLSTGVYMLGVRTPGAYAVHRVLITP
ncbi:MAG: alpha/beta hydrolase [Flavobacteriales bacterium]|nr:alpha/beta hydrolase [Flavobacteriales bacterium]